MLKTGESSFPKWIMVERKTCDLTHERDHQRPPAKAHLFTLLTSSFTSSTNVRTLFCWTSLLQGPTWSASTPFFNFKTSVHLQTSKISIEFHNFVLLLLLCLNSMWVICWVCAKSRIWEIKVWMKIWSLHSSEVWFRAFFSVFREKKISSNLAATADHTPARKASTMAVTGRYRALSPSVIDPYQCFGHLTRNAFFEMLYNRKLFWRKKQTKKTRKIMTQRIRKNNFPKTKHKENYYKPLLQKTEKITIIVINFS